LHVVEPDSPVPGSLGEINININPQPALILPRTKFSTPRNKGMLTCIINAVSSSAEDFHKVRDWSKPYQEQGELQGMKISEMLV
jgi:hypothetical protein